MEEMGGQETHTYTHAHTWTHSHTQILRTALQLREGQGPPGFQAGLWTHLQVLGIDRSTGALPGPQAQAQVSICLSLPSPTTRDLLPPAEAVRSPTGGPPASRLGADGKCFSLNRHCIVSGTVSPTLASQWEAMLPRLRDVREGAAVGGGGLWKEASSARSGLEETGP